MRVVHVITSLTTGGAERQLELLVGRSRHRHAVIALYAGGPVADSLRAAGHPVRVLGATGWRKALLWPRLALLLRRYRPDVVHVHLLSGQLWGIPAARLAGVPVVLSSEHSLMADTIEGRPHSGWLRFLYRRLERLSSHTIAVSSATAERLRGWGVAPDRITVVDNGIDFAASAFSGTGRRTVRAELAITDEVIVIGAVARLSPVKRLDELLRGAADRLRAGGHVLIVAGTGELEAELKGLATKLGISDAVRWLGARDDVPQLLSAMDVLVSPSRDETFGMAVVEALANGLPVIYGQAPALDGLEVPADQAVRLHSAEPEKEIRTALDDVLDRILESPGDAARWPAPEQLRARYGADRAAARVDDIYRRPGVRP